MSSRKRKTNSKQGEKLYIFARCRECGTMFNCQTEKFTVTAAGDRFCDKCYYGIGWQNLTKPYENYSEGRTLKTKRYTDDEPSLI